MRQGVGRGRALLILAAVLVGALVLGVCTGSASISPTNVFRLAFAGLTGQEAPPGLSSTHLSIVWNLRVPRVILASMVGVGLASAGAAFQGLFKNPLADPYILGISSGAALGAAFGLVYGLTWTVLGMGAVPVLAFMGGVVSITAVYHLARVNGTVPVMSLLLAGVALGAFLSAALALLMYTDVDRVGQVVFWLLGSLSGANWTKVWMAVPYLLLGLAIILLHSRELNALLLGEEPAQHLGVDVERVKRSLLLGGTLATAAAVSVSGVIGFLGLIVPHGVRLVVGPDHRFLLPVTALMGASFMVLADTLARTVLAPAELPVGILTAFCGGPFFLYILRQRKGRLF